MAVDAAVGHQADQVKGRVIVDGGLYRADEGGVFKEVAVRNGFGNARELLIDDATRADIRVADLAVAHLPVGQADIHAGGADIGHRAFSHELVKPGRFRRRDGISVIGRIVAEAIHNT